MSVSIKEAGPFMEGISEKCFKSGGCELKDILIVFSNIGNYTLFIVGALVLLMYIWGGIQFLTARGESGKIESGKKIIGTATIGLFIVFFAQLGVLSLQKGLTTGSLFLDKDTIICDAGVENGTACSEASVCLAGACLPKCYFNHQDGGYSCETELGGLTCDADPKLCPGDGNARCCNTAPTPK